MLIDIRQMQGRLTMLENFQAGASFNKRIGDVADRIAIVDQAREDYVKGNQFFQLVAVNRNVFVKFFASIEDAQAWLSGANIAASGETPAPS